MRMKGAFSHASTSFGVVALRDTRKLAPVYDRLAHVAATFPQVVWHWCGRWPRPLHKKAAQYAPHFSIS